MWTPQSYDPVPGVGSVGVRGLGGGAVRRLLRRPVRRLPQAGRPLPAGIRIQAAQPEVRRVRGLPQHRQQGDN